MTPSINLIPATRLEAQQRRRRVRAWIGTVGMTAGVVAAGSVWSLLSIVESGAEERARLDERSARISQLEEGRDAKLAELADANARLRATLVVTLEPDWSILMALLAATLEEDAALEGFRLVPTSRGEGADEDRRPGYVVMLSGVSTSQGGVSSWVLRLEGLGLFDQVTLKEWHRRSLEDEEMVAFNVECVLAARGEGGR